jgi:hypothetical protein
VSDILLCVIAMTHGQFRIPLVLAHFPLVLFGAHGMVAGSPSVSAFSLVLLGTQGMIAGFP